MTEEDQQAEQKANLEFDYASETGVSWKFMGRELSFLIPYRIAEAVAAYMPQYTSKEKP